MPSYYFRLTDGKQVLNNHEGIDVSGDAAAHEDAVALARDLEHGVVTHSTDTRSTRCRSPMLEQIH